MKIHRGHVFGTLVILGILVQVLCEYSYVHGMNDAVKIINMQFGTRLQIVL